MSTRRIPLSQKLGHAKLRVEELETRALPSVTLSHLPVGVAAPAVSQVQSVIVSQPYDGLGMAGVSQVFTDALHLKDTAYEFDDFTTTQPYLVTVLTAPGIDEGASAANKAVIGQIWTGLPDKGGSKVMSGSGSENQGTLDISFGRQLLHAGSYWITAYVVRPGNNGGSQWFWDLTTPVTGSEEYFYNPLGGFGFGTSSIPGSTIFGAPHNMAFTLYGDAVASEATALTGLGASHITAISQPASHASQAMRILDQAFAGSSTHGSHASAVLHHSGVTGQSDVLTKGLGSIWDGIE